MLSLPSAPPPQGGGKPGTVALATSTVPPATLPAGHAAAQLTPGLVQRCTAALKDPVVGTRKAALQELKVC